MISNLICRTHMLWIMIYINAYFIIYINTYFIDNSTNELEQTSPSDAKEIRQLKKNVEVN